MPEGESCPPLTLMMLGAGLDHLQEGSRQVHLGTGHREAVVHFPEDGGNQPATPRRDAFDWPSVGPKNHAGDMGAMFGNRPAPSVVASGKRLNGGELRSSEARVVQVNWTIQNGNANPRIAERFRPKFRKPWNGSNIRGSSK